MQACGGGAGAGAGIPPLVTPLSPHTHIMERSLGEREATSKGDDTSGNGGGLALATDSVSGSRRLGRGGHSKRLEFDTRTPDAREREFTADGGPLLRVLCPATLQEEGALEHALAAAAWDVESWVDAAVVGS